MEKQISSYSERDRKYAWDYFSMHSAQRISTFNFYITLALALSTGVATALQPSINLPIIAIVLSTVLMLISFVFYKLDRRNTMLIKRAEVALKEEENRLESELLVSSSFSLFRIDEEDVKQQRSKKSFWFWKNYYSYSDCFNLVFTIFGILGVSGVIFAIMLTIL